MGLSRLAMRRSRVCPWLTLTGHGTPLCLIAKQRKRFAFSCALLYTRTIPGKSSWRVCTMPFPRMLRLRQKFDCPRLDDIPEEVERQLAALKLADKVLPGQSVAITVGSRGIAN